MGVIRRGEGDYRRRRAGVTRDDGVKEGQRGSGGGYGGTGRGEGSEFTGVREGKEGREGWIRRDRDKGRRVRVQGGAEGPYNASLKTHMGRFSGIVAWALVYQEPLYPNLSLYLYPYSPSPLNLLPFPLLPYSLQPDITLLLVLLRLLLALMMMLF